MTRDAIRSRVTPPSSRWRTWQAQALLAVCLGLAFIGPYLFVNVLAAHRDRQWMQSGLSLHEIGEWRDDGFTDVREAVRWRNARFKPPGARLWRNEGIGPEEALGWREAEFAPREAARWRAQGFAAREAEPWRVEGFLPEDAKGWRAAGVAPADAATKRKRGDRPR